MKFFTPLLILGSFAASSLAAPAPALAASEQAAVDLFKRQSAALADIQNLLSSVRIATSQINLTAVPFQGQQLSSGQRNAGVSAISGSVRSLLNSIAFATWEAALLHNSQLTAAELASLVNAVQSVVLEIVYTLLYAADCLGVSSTQLLGSATGSLTTALSTLYSTLNNAVSGFRAATTPVLTVGAGIGGGAGVVTAPGTIVGGIGGGTGAGVGIGGVGVGAGVGGGAVVGLAPWSNVIAAALPGIPAGFGFLPGVVVPAGGLGGGQLGGIASGLTGGHAH